jgi:hypothetical protein
MMPSVRRNKEIVNMKKNVFMAFVFLMTGDIYSAVERRVAWGVVFCRAGGWRRDGDSRFVDDVPGHAGR